MTQNKILKDINNTFDNENDVTQCDCASTGECAELIIVSRKLLSKHHTPIKQLTSAALHQRCNQSGVCNFKVIQESELLCEWISHNRMVSADGLHIKFQCQI